MGLTAQLVHSLVPKFPSGPRAFMGTHQEIIMLDISTLYALIVLAVPVVVYLVATRFWREQGNGEKPHVRYHPDSQLCKQVADACSTLNSYTPPMLWGWNGHIQTCVFGTIGRFSIPKISGKRYNLVLKDGSTLSYDVFGGGNASYTIIVCPGIGNTTESSYIRAFVALCLEEGFHVAVLNHLGGLDHTPLTGNRIFTYGGTGDLAAMFDSLRSHFPDHKFIGVGFSLGACILVRFLGEKVERQQHFICAVSVCQGYDPTKVAPNFNDWTRLRRMYNAIITRKQLRLFHRHKQRLLESSHYGNTSSDITHGGHDCNGFSLDPTRIQPPDYTKMQTLTNMAEFDEYFSRRVQGFDSVMAMYKWTSCVELMHRIEKLPMLLVNTLDDPVVPEHLHDIPAKYTDHNPNAMFVRTTYGGHVAFFEGGVLVPNPFSWIDRLILEYSRACVNLEATLHG